MARIKIMFLEVLFYYYELWLTIQLSPVGTVNIQ